MFVHVFLANQALDPGLLQLVLSAHKITKASELRAKDSGREVDIGEGGNKLFRG